MSVTRSLVMLSMMVGTASDAQTTRVDDGPRGAIERYFTAHALGKAEFIGQAFAPDARIQFVDQGVAKAWSTEEFAARFQSPAADEYGRVRRIESLDADGTTASAILTLDYPDVLFKDRLSLLKAEGGWRIVNKVFSADRRDRAKETIREVLTDWSSDFEPRRIIGNIYYVGSSRISSFLIVSPAGHILIDTGHVAMLAQVEANIRKLGFDPRDVKILLNSHAHFDHCGGFAQFKRQVSAVRIIASRADGELMARGGKGDFHWGDRLSYEPVTPDRIISDGEPVSLGAITLTAHSTPGHTKGCTSWSMQADENGKSYQVLFLCGLTVSSYKLTNNAQYPDVVADARASLTRLRQQHVDVLLAAHGFWFDLQSKAARQTEGGANPFIDPQELGRHLSEMEADLERALQAQERTR